MFKLSEIRNLNQVRLFYNDKKNETNQVFAAYLRQGYTFKQGIKTGDAFAPISQLVENATTLSLINEALSYIGRPETAVLNVPRKMTFTGGEWTSFSIQCSLFVVEDFKKDILDPITSLQQFLLPGDSEDFNSKDYWDSIHRAIDEKTKESIARHSKSNPNYTGGIWELAQKGVSALEKYIGDISLMTLPGQFQDSAKSLVLTLPGLRVPDVFIESVDFTVPYVKYSTPDNKPFVDRVDLSLNIQTMRVVTQNYIKFLRNDLD